MKNRRTVLHVFDSQFQVCTYCNCLPVSIPTGCWPDSCTRWPHAYLPATRAARCDDSTSSSSWDCLTCPPPTADPVPDHGPDGRARRGGWTRAAGQPARRGAARRSRYRLLYLSALAGLQTLHIRLAPPRRAASSWGPARRLASTPRRTSAPCSE